ncbi:MAG: hypothetical protein JNK82_31770, partial [Myxococcaceae bacterium]|nr:hypothetical protein [Myxococcaceae bacterium]
MKPGFAFVALLGALGLSCSGAPPVVPVELGPETCDNGKDDNGDKKVDCADPKCFSSAKCKIAVERCDNGVDDDNNGNTDCLDAACEGFDCGAGCVCRNQSRSESSCGDGQDNDADNLTDCGDFDCRMTPPCGGTAGGSGTAGSGTAGSGTAGSGTAGSGTAGSGTAGSGGVGGGSSGTAGGSSGTAGGGTGGTAGGGMMTGPENCADGVDNDGDRAVDCVDTSCAGTSACVNLPDGAACTANAQCAGGLCNNE